jgi:hypothetical protein
MCIPEYLHFLPTCSFKESKVVEGTGAQITNIFKVYTNLPAVTCQKGEYPDHSGIHGQGGPVKTM